MPHDLTPERADLIRRIAASASPTTALLEALRHELDLGPNLPVQLLDRVPDDDLPQLAAAAAEHLPHPTAQVLGEQLLLQAPHLFEEHADRLRYGDPYHWRDEQLDGEHSLSGLPAHHIAFPHGIAWRDDQARRRSLGADETWLALPERGDPTWDPAAAPVGTGRIGGPAAGECAACGWQLQLLLDFGTFLGVADGSVPSRLVVCPNFPCMWGEQHFTHADAAPTSVTPPHGEPSGGMPVPEPVPELPVTFHLTPPRWQVQDWGSSNDNQNLNRLGGPGSWIQDAIHPDCPSCEQTMPIIAQFDGMTPFEDSYGWERWTEGLIYAFWCRDCRISATSSQQT